MLLPRRRSGRIRRLEPGTARAAPFLRDFDLRRGADRTAPTRALDRHLHKSSVNSLIGSSGQNRLGRGCGKAARVPAGTKVYCFDRTDTATKKWIPQGITSVSDAVENERWAGGGRPMVVSWHNSGKVRITFVDPAKRTYRHVLLVEPVMKGRRATPDGWDATGTSTTATATATSCRRPAAGCSRAARSAPSAGDRPHPHVVALPRPDDAAAFPHRGRVLPAALAAGRVVTWPLRGIEGGGTTRANWAARLPGDRIQGGVRTRGHWWFTHYRDMKPGWLLSTSRAGGKWSPVRRRTISIGPEDLACHRGQHRIWTLAEHARKRALWGFPADSCS